MFISLQNNYECFQDNGDHNCSKNTKGDTVLVGALITLVLGTLLTPQRLEQSRSQRIVWLLDECKIDYEIKVYKRINMRADPELKNVHPLGKSPVVGIEAAGGAPIILAESGLITEYFTEHFAPHLAPQRYVDGKEGPGLETESWLRYKFYLHYAEGSLMPVFVSNLLFNCM